MTLILTILNVGFIILVLSAGALLSVTFNAHDTIARLGVLMFFVAMGTAPIFATTPTLAMEASNCSTGSAAAMLVTFEMGIGALAAFSVGIFHDGSSRPLGLTIAALVGCGLLTYLIKQK